MESSAACHPQDGNASEDGLSAQLRAGGVAVKVEGNVGGEAADFNRFALVGDQRTIEFTEWLAKRDGQPLAASGRPGYLRHLDQLAAFIEGRPHVLPGFAEALAVQETIEAMLRGTSRTAR